MSQTTSLVTVGLPVHDGEAYLADAIRSILDQEHVDLELLIADNGSTDRTEEICRAAIEDDARVNYLRSPSNRGAAWNFNRLVDAARGTYFKWAAHDDLCGPGLLAACVGVLAADPRVSLAHGGVVKIDDVGHRLHRSPPLDGVRRSSAIERARDILANPTDCVEVFGVMRTADVRTTGLIGGYTSSDRTFLFEMALRGRFQQVPEVLLLHRQHELRSVHSHASARDRDAWFDPQRTAGRTMPRWRLLAEHVRAIARADLPVPDRSRVALAVGWWSLGKAPSLARDAAGYVRSVALDVLLDGPTDV